MMKKEIHPPMCVISVQSLWKRCVQLFGIWNWIFDTEREFQSRNNMFNCAIDLQELVGVI